MHRDGQPVVLRDFDRRSMDRGRHNRRALDGVQHRHTTTPATHHGRTVEQGRGRKIADVEILQGVAGDRTRQLEGGGETRWNEQLDKIRPHVVIDNHVIAHDFVADGGSDGEPQLVLRADACERDDDRLGSSRQPDQCQPGGRWVGTWLDPVAGGRSRIELGRHDRPLRTRPDRATVTVAAHDDIEYLVRSSAEDCRRVDCGPSEVSTVGHNVVAAVHDIPGQVDAPHGEPDVIAVARTSTVGPLPRHDRSFADRVEGAAVDGDLGLHAACDVLGVEHALGLIRRNAGSHRQRERPVARAGEARPGGPDRLQQAPGPRHRPPRSAR